MLKNKYFYKVEIFLCFCVFVICVLKIAVLPGGVLEDFIDGAKLEDENSNYKNLGTNPQVRVLIMSGNFSNNYHGELNISGEDMTVYYGEDYDCEVEVEEIVLTKDHEFLKEGKVKITTGEMKKLTVNNLQRSYSNPGYYGEFEIYLNESGLVLINELPLETYLKGVVPSEMPSSYHEEALKVQAICARSYAYNQMQTISYPEFDAHMNDSVAFQVYNNTKETENTNQAILATAGEKIGMDGKVVTSYFFSTSSGHTTDVRAWGTKLGNGNSYLKGVKVAGDCGDYEKELPWYKWEVEVSSETLQAILELNLSKKIGKLSKVEILESGAGDVALKIKITGSESTAIVEGENSIRKAFGSGMYTIVKNDGTKTKGMDLLPSAFFTIEKSNDIFLISGGGLGHGIGMSQNGANEMAKEGMGYIEILSFFYKDIEIFF